MSRTPQSVKTIHSIDDILADTDSPLGRLVKHAGYLAHIESLLNDLVDVELTDHFQVAAARKNRVILITPTAAWATRLRMHAPRLISSLHSAGQKTIEHIDIRVAPLSLEPVEKRCRRSLSPAAAQALELMAQLGSWDKE